MDDKNSPRPFPEAGTENKRNLNHHHAIYETRNYCLSGYCKAITYLNFLLLQLRWFTDVDF